VYLDNRENNDMILHFFKS